ncbi:MAG TPA: hypothetical protein VFQ61_32965, partial [Polyangiaceae bacterium]|nr:hypothetical protein [Polyangiaceae bacterium]
QALLGIYPDLFMGGVAISGVPCGCWAASYTGDSGSSAQWSGPCAGGQVSKSAQEWGDQVRAMFPGYTGHRPRVQLWHGKADTTINYNNQVEAIKEWTNLLALSATPTVTDTAKAGQTHQTWKSACGYTVLETFALDGIGHSVNWDLNTAAKFLGLDQPVTTDPEAAACPSNGTGGAGGVSGAGGAAGSGGSSGGRSASGGAMSAGGSAGNSSPGGSTSTAGGAGAAASGGAPSASGGNSSGGSTNTAGNNSGGAVAQSGALGAGGASAAAGASNPAMGTGGGASGGSNTSGGSNGGQNTTGTSPAQVGGSAVAGAPSAGVDASSGCGCRVVSPKRSLGAMGALAFVAAAFGLRRARKRRE